MFKEKSILESLEARRLARKTANKGGLINRLKYREAFLIGGLAAKGVANIIKRLPNKVYHGGTDLASAKGGVEKVKGIFTGSRNSIPSNDITVCSFDSLQKINPDDVPSNFTTFYFNSIKEDSGKIKNIKFNKAEDVYNFLGDYQKTLTKAGKGDVTTEIKPLGRFYFAEDYHQQYLVKNPNGYCALQGTGCQYVCE